MNKILQKKLISTFLLMGVLSLFAFLSIGYTQYHCLSQTYYNLIESYQTIRAANQTLLSIDEATLSVTTFLESKDSEILPQIPPAIIAAQVNFETLVQLASDNTYQNKLATELKVIFTNKILFLNQIIDNYKRGNIQQAMQIASDKNRLRKSQEISKLIIEIRQEEINQLNTADLDLIASKRNSIKLLSITGTLTGLLFLICFMLLNKLFKYSENRIKSS